MNSLRAYYKTQIGERYGHQAHVDDGTGKQAIFWTKYLPRNIAPLCGNRLKTGGETEYPEWKEFPIKVTCKYCLKKVEK